MNARKKKILGGVSVVVGASAGLGRAIAIELGRRGAKVALLARGEERLRAACEEVERAGGMARYYVVDVVDGAQVAHAAKAIERDFAKPITVWINNAMVTVLSSVLETSAEEYEQVTRVNYLGTVHGTRAALERMRSRNEGHILNVGSALSYRAIPLQSAYCASKHAIRGFTDALRCELIHDKSRVLLTMPQLPAMNTPQFQWCRTRFRYQPQPVPPIYDPHVAARAIVNVIGTRRRELYIGGSTVQAILGSKFIPGLLDRYLAKKAYSGQRTSDELPSGRPDNLFQTVPLDVGVHGLFAKRAKMSSAQTWLITHRWAYALGAFVALLVVVGAWVLAREPAVVTRLGATETQQPFAP